MVAGYRIGWCVNGDPIILKVGGSDRILDRASNEDAVRTQALIDFNLVGWNGPQRKKADPFYPDGMEPRQVTAYPGPWQVGQAKRS